MADMEYLNWELSVLSRAVAYSNLSAAAAHVGVSQPQLSRIVSKLEEQLSVSLLNRQSKRTSAWTAAAYRLAEIYSNTLRGFRGELQVLTQGNQVSHLKIGTLEGLQEIAIEFSRFVLEKLPVRTLELDIHDLNDLEEKFARQDLDLIFTSREPGARKFRHIRTLGYQTIEKLRGQAAKVRVMSTFEYGTESQLLKSGHPDRLLVSNSLGVRKRWLETLKASGTLPSKVQRARKSGDSPVLLVGTEELPEKVWSELAGFKY